MELKLFGKNSSSDNFVTICVKFVRTEEGAGEATFSRLQAPFKEPLFRWPFGMTPQQEPQQAGAVPKRLLAIKGFSI